MVAYLLLIVAHPTFLIVVHPTIGGDMVMQRDA